MQTTDLTATSIFASMTAEQQDKVKDMISMGFSDLHVQKFMDTLLAR